MKYFLSTILITLLTGCSWAGSLAGALPGPWFKGDKDCTGTDCDRPRTESASISTSTETYHCYGTLDRSWQCSEDADESKIIAIIPIESDPSEALARTVTAPVVETVETLLPTPVPAEIQDTAGPAPEIIERDTRTVFIESDRTAAILAAEETAFTVQFIALQQLEQLFGYARKIGLENAQYTRVEKDGDQWYVLLLGIYPDFETAEAALQQWSMTRDLQAEPWIRNLAPLQESIRLLQSRG